MSKNSSQYRLNVRDHQRYNSGGEEHIFMAVEVGGCFNVGGVGIVPHATEWFELRDRRRSPPLIRESMKHTVAIISTQTTTFELTSVSSDRTQRL